METVYQVIEDYKDWINGNASPLHGFKVGDKVKPAPHVDKVTLESIDLIVGEVIKISNDRIIIEVGKKGSYDLRNIGEFYLMPAEE